MRTLREFWTTNASAKAPLHAWYERVEAADWSSYADLRRDYPAADLVADKVVFNVGGNNYRVICYVPFGKRTVYILWVGTHAEYDALSEKDIRKL